MADERLPKIDRITDGWGVKDLSSSRIPEHGEGKLAPSMPGGDEPPPSWPLAGPVGRERDRVVIATPAPPPPEERYPDPAVRGLPDAWRNSWAGGGREADDRDLAGLGEDRERATPDTMPSQPKTGFRLIGDLLKSLFR